MGNDIWWEKSLVYCKHLLGRGKRGQKEPQSKKKKLTSTSSRNDVMLWEQNEDY